jgi:type III restriction enzyme
VAAAVGQPAWRPHGSPGHGARPERADRGGQRELQGLRQRRCRRTSASRCRPGHGGKRGLLHRQGAQDATGDVEVTPQLAKQIYGIWSRTTTPTTMTAFRGIPRRQEVRARWPPCRRSCRPYAEQVFQLIDSVFSDKQLPQIGRRPPAKKNPLNDNFDKQEVQGPVEPHQSQGRVQRAVRLRRAGPEGGHGDERQAPRVTPLQYTIQRGEQADITTLRRPEVGPGLRAQSHETESNRQHSVHSAVKYDLIGKLAEGTQLTRRTVGGHPQRA